MPTISVDRLKNTWQNVQSSLWFLPTILGLLALFLSYTVPIFDQHLPRDIAVKREWLFYGSPDAARTLISTLAGSLITVISLLFSITMLTLQQASTQFTSRVLRTFTNDRGVQWVLGTYIATFVYCILILRRIRSSTDQSSRFVPVVSITLAIVLAVICVALLVYYVHHIAMLLQSATVIERVHASLLAAIEQNYPSRSDDDDTDADDRSNDFSWPSDERQVFRVHAHSYGFLRSIDEKSILNQIPEGSSAVIELPLGQYVPKNTVLLKSSEAIDDTDRLKKIRSAFILESQRSLPDDVLFGVQQLVDIGVRALSPSTNDPTTAEHVIAALSNALIDLGDRAFPSAIQYRTNDQSKKSMLRVRRANYDEFVEAAFAQIRRNARNDVDVTLHLLRALRSVASRVSEERARPLWEQVALIVSQINESSFLEADREMLLRVANTGDEVSAIDGRVAGGDSHVPIQ